MIDPSNQRYVAPTLVLAGLWTAAVWGSRLRLLTAGEAANWPTVARIVVSLALAGMLLLLAVGASSRQSSGAPAILFAFSVWMVIVWVPATLSVAAGNGSLSFKGVHTVLAIVSLAFGAALAGQARREMTFSRPARRSGPPRTAVPGIRSSR